MVVLTGKNLGERQRELNNKVADAIVNKKNFDDIKSEDEITDIDKLYKIDIASQYKDIDYIVEVLKSGDSLYISRALKCLWLYQDNYSNVINIENLQANIFPFMSIKMKKKMLSTISMHIQNSGQAANYFNYCKKNRLVNIALKFLNLTSEEFKMNVLTIKNLFPLFSHINTRIKLQNFVRNSFVIATTYIETYEYNRTNIVNNLRHLYALNNEKYLDILEKYEIVALNRPNNLKRLGIGMSKDIMLKYKKRVLDNPLLYVNKLNKNMLVKYSSKCEAEKYMISLIPKDVKEFWEIDFCTAYYFVLNLIPINEKFEYVKQLFNKKYPGDDFEMSIHFYKLKYYNMMSIDQRELWALNHINNQKEILGAGNDYIWYKFVQVDKALLEIKKYIMVTPDNNKRASIVNILVEAARDQNDLIKVLNYYYERHANEKAHNKNDFIDKVLSVHNVFEFSIKCWEALNKLFYSLNIYSVGSYTDKIFVALAVVCHILHNIDMPRALTNFVDLDVNYSYFSMLLEKMGKEKSEIVFHYLLKLFVDKLQPFERDPHNKKLREKLKKYVNNIFNILKCFQKEDHECPDIVKNFMDIHSPKAEEPKMVNAKDILHIIKTDARLAVDVFGHSDIHTKNHRGILNCILRKLKLYFHNDVAQAYINILHDTIHNSSDDYNSCKLINSAIFAIFQLGDENCKVSLMEKYCPSQPKIDHSAINRKELYIQKAICTFVGYSRPPVPLENVVQYIKGDYVHYCLPMFNMYLANLPLPLMMTFTESILNAPLSVQKHGLRLAFECYTSACLKVLVLTTWKNTKNVSLRMIIYKSIFDKVTDLISSGNDESAKILYEALKFFTSDLHQDDREDVFELVSGYRRCVPNMFIDDYLQTAWQMVIKLPQKAVNIDRQIKVVKSMERNIKLLQREFVRKNLIDKHVYEMLEIKGLHSDEITKSQELWNAKWNLIAAYIVQYNNNEELKENLELISYIFKKCIEMWNTRYKGTYIFQKFYFDFITYIEDKGNRIPIFQHILDMLLEALPLKQIYLIVWKLKLTIYLEISLNVTNTAVFDGDGISKSLSREEILSDNITNHIEKFVQELVVKHQFYPVYLPTIASLLKNIFWCLNGMKNLDIFFCQSLAKVGLKETHLLTLMILPANVSDEIKEVHASILEKIQAFENEEIQSFLHLKFFTNYNTYFQQLSFIDHR